MLRNSKFILAGLIFLLLCGQVEAQGIGPVAGGGGGLSVPNFIRNGGLPHMQACLAKVKASAGSCTIVNIGESTGVSNDSQYNGVAWDSACCGYFRQTAAVLSTIYGINTQSNDVIGNKALDGLTASSATFLAFDTRVTSLGAWQIFTGSGLTIGGYNFLATDTSAITFHPTDVVSFPATPAIQTNAIDVWVNSVSTITVKIGATTVCTITTTGITSCPATLGDNTYSITCAGAFGCDIQGFTARNTNIQAVYFYNGAFGGATIAQQQANISQIEALNPTLCVINDLGNDIANNTTPSVYQASLVAVIHACQLTGDVLLTTGVIGDAPNGPACSECVAIRAAVRAAGVATGASVWDSGLTITSPELNDNFGWNGANNKAAVDPNHPGAVGYGMYGTLLAQILMIP